MAASWVRKSPTEASFVEVVDREDGLGSWTVTLGRVRFFTASAKWIASQGPIDAETRASAFASPAEAMAAVRRWVEEDRTREEREKKAHDEAVCALDAAMGVVDEHEQRENR